MGSRNGTLNRCLKIKYMFPKAHAAAYMISALRLGWYKVHRPRRVLRRLLLLCAAKILTVPLVVQGREAVRRKMNEITMKGKEATARRKRMRLPPSRLSMKCWPAAYEVLPVDLYKSDARQVSGGGR